MMHETQHMLASPSRLTRLGWLALLLFVASANGCLSLNKSSAWKPPVVAASQLSPTSQAALARWKRGDPTVVAASGKGQGEELSEFTPPKASKVVLSPREAFLRQPTRENAFVLAELHYALADKAEREVRPESVTEFYLAAAYSYFHLFGDPDSIADNARMAEVHHSSLARCIRSAQSFNKNSLRELSIQLPDGPLVIPVVLNAEPWRPDDVDQLMVVGNYDLELTHRHRRPGVGVPVVAMRHRHDDGSLRDAFFAPRQAFSVTAILHPDLDRLLNRKTSEQTTARLELHDPCRVKSIDFGGKRVLPLAADFTAPLVACENTQEFMRLDWLGFREPARVAKLSGLYFLEPYQPGKIPIIFVHGLWSDMHTWDETINELRAVPEIRDRYQFAVYLYPTGNAFAVNAMRLRQKLRDLKKLTDAPDPALDQMILIGHSMGGIIARLQIVGSENRLWEMIAHSPPEQLKMTPETRRLIDDTFFFEPNPSIKRVVFIGTPQRGSNFGGSWMRNLASSLVNPPSEMTEIRKKLEQDNPGAFRPFFLRAIPTSVDNLAMDNPTLRAINQMSFGPSTRLHSIIGTGKMLFQSGDGLVPVSSARIAGTESELYVDDWHTSLHRDPNSIREIVRILNLRD